jgi:hypothetical protein
VAADGKPWATCRGGGLRKSDVQNLRDERREELDDADLRKG